MNKILKYSLMSISVSALVLGLTACGGGSSSSTASSSSEGNNIVFKGQASLGGSIVPANSNITASSFKATADIEVDLTSSAILVVDSNANEEFGDSSDIVLASAVSTDGSFHFGQINIKEEGETKAQLTVNKEGFAPYTQILTLTNGQDISVIADAGSIPLLTEAVDISKIRAKGTLASSFLEIGTKNTSTGVNSYSKIKSLSELKALADVPLDTDVLTKSIIPLSTIADSVTSIKAETQSFDPTNEDDIDKFPGNFIGVGESGKEEKQRLVSVGFDFMSLTDQNGNPIELDKNKLSDSSKLLPQAIDYNTCLRESTRTISGTLLDEIKDIGDYDKSTTDIFEIPLWYYNSRSGDWQYLGQAEVYEDSTANTSFTKDSTVDRAYAKMCITENWGKYINLDYSFAIEKPLNVCVVAKDQDENAITDLKLVAKKGTTRDYKYLNSNGKTNLSLTAGTEISDYTFSYSGTLTGWNATTVQSSDIITGGEESCDNTINIQVVNPYSATLKVTALKPDGTIAANEYVRVYRSVRDDYFSKNVYTDENGLAEFKVKPNIDYGVSYKSTKADINVNTTTVAPELADNGRIATITIKEEESAPEVYIYVYDNTISDTAESLNFYVSASDKNNDDISLKSITLNGTSLSLNTDYTVSEKYNYTGREFFRAKLDLSTATVKAIMPKSLSAGEYSIEAIYSDIKGEGKDSQRFTVNENRAPVVSSVYLYNNEEGYTYFNKNIKAGTYDIKAYSYDLDGDTIENTYTLDDTLLDNTEVVLTDGDHKLVVTATETNNAGLIGSKTFEFFVGNNAPEITSFGSTSYSIDLASHNKTIQLYAYASDKNGDDIVIKSKDGNITFTPSYIGSNYFRSGDITIDGNTTFEIFANDGDKDSASKSLTVSTYTANQSPIFTQELTAQQVEIGTSLELTCMASDPEKDTLSYAWFIDNVKQSETGTTLTHTFNTSAVVSCTATDADILEPITTTSTASITVYDPSASGNLVINTIPGVIVATHDSVTLKPLVTKTTDDNGKITFPIAGTDRTTFSISIGPDVPMPKETIFQATLLELSYELNEVCNNKNETIPNGCSDYKEEAFKAGSTISNTLIELVTAEDDTPPSEVDTNNNGSIDSDELYTFEISQVDDNKDGIITWNEYNTSESTTSEFFINVPVREYTIDLDAYTQDYYDYNYEELTYTPSTINFSGFEENVTITLKEYTSIQTDTSGNATISSETMFSSDDGKYSYIAKYVDENDVTKYYLALDKTAEEVKSVSLTPADFNLTGTAISFIIGESQNINVRSSYKDQDLEYTWAINYNMLVKTMLNDSRLTYNIESSEYKYDLVTNTTTNKGNWNYYGDGTLKSAYDIADYPNLNIEMSFTSNKVNISGSDISKVTYGGLDYYGYGQSNEMNSNVNISLNYTVVPNSISVPVIKEILPSVIANSLPSEMSYTNYSVNLEEYKGMNETDFINAITSDESSLYENGVRHVNFQFNPNQEVIPQSTFKNVGIQKNVKPFSIGFKARPFNAK